jgi:hypothetical protein
MQEEMSKMRPVKAPPVRIAHESKRQAAGTKRKAPPADKKPKETPSSAKKPTSGESFPESIPMINTPPPASDILPTLITRFELNQTGDPISLVS